jgi:hypothetical protein
MQVLRKVAMRPSSFAGKFGQRWRLKGEAVPARDQRELATSAQNSDHLHPFRHLGICLGSPSVRHCQAGLLTSSCEESDVHGRLVSWQDKDHGAIRCGTKDTIRVAHNPQLTSFLFEAQNRQAAFCGGRPSIEGPYGPRQRTQRQRKYCRGQKMHLLKNLPDGVRQHHITTISNDRYALMATVSTAGITILLRRPNYGR